MEQKHGAVVSAGRNGQAGVGDHTYPIRRPHFLRKPNKPPTSASEGGRLFCRCALFYSVPYTFTSVRCTLLLAELWVMVIRT